jgi:hypothetical protein
MLSNLDRLMALDGSTRPGAGLGHTGDIVDHYLDRSPR